MLDKYESCINCCYFNKKAKKCTYPLYKDMTIEFPNLHICHAFVLDVDNWYRTEYK